MGGMTENGQRRMQALGLKAENVCIDAEKAGITLTKTPDGVRITVQEEAYLGRAAMLARTHAGDEEGTVVHEEMRFGSLGVMLDCARNAVPKPETIMRLIDLLANMGYNELQLYLEDVFELPGYPYFGYGRGRYTHEELRGLDAYAAERGIELVPAIQTLAHLPNALRWTAMQPLVDTGDILLTDEEETYRLIEAMVGTMRDCFQTGRINIGMDEAHMLGLGRYLDKHGYQNRTEIMLRHFERVHEIAVRYGFEPMMWSDMFFRLACGGEYYAPDCIMDKRVGERIPDDTTLIYWDYYTEKQEAYERMLGRHIDMGAKTAFAAGAWKWSGFAPCNAYSMARAEAAFAACMKTGIDRVLVTMWGDNGAECSPYAVLPSLMQWAELCWTGKAEPTQMESRFEAACGARMTDFMALDGAAYGPANPAPGKTGINLSKWLVYEDVMQPLLTHEMDAEALCAHLAACRERLEQVHSETYAPLFDEQLALVTLMEDKCRVQYLLRKAWRQKDREALEGACDLLDVVLEEADAFTRALHVRWREENRAAGLDVLDLRLGGMMQRVRTAKERVELWLDGACETIEELDMPLLPYDGEPGKMVSSPMWHRIASPCGICQI